MLIHKIVSDAFGANCRVIGFDDSQDCIVVDPGMGVLTRISQVVAAHERRVVAVLLTHGHLDHTYAVADLCAIYDVPCYIHPADREMLIDPFLWLGDEFAPQFQAILPKSWRWSCPRRIVEVGDGALLELAGIEFLVDHVPGHTAGSVMYRFSHGDSVYCLVGDILAAGTIGRTDMPGGDRRQTMVSLRRFLDMDDSTILLPGHGPDTSVGSERSSNPFIVAASKYLSTVVAGTTDYPQN